MTFRVELEPDVEAQLAMQAQAEGLSLEEFLSRALGAIAHPNKGASAINSPAWAREFHAWVQGHPTDTPLLSDETMSRDSIYRERGL